MTRDADRRRDKLRSRVARRPRAQAYVCTSSYCLLAWADIQISRTRVLAASARRSVVPQRRWRSRRWLALGREPWCPASVRPRPPGTRPSDEALRISGIQCDRGHLSVLNMHKTETPRRSCLIPVREGRRRAVQPSSSWTVVMRNGRWMLPALRSTRAGGVCDRIIVTSHSGLGAACGLGERWFFIPFRYPRFGRQDELMGPLDRCTGLLRSLARSGALRSASDNRYVLSAWGVNFAAVRVVNRPVPDDRLANGYGRADSYRCDE